MVFLGRLQEALAKELGFAGPQRYCCSSFGCAASLEEEWLESAFSFLPRTLLYRILGQRFIVKILVLIKDCLSSLYMPRFA